MSNTTKKIASAIKDASEAKTKGYDTSATVKRVEGNTIWVHIPGGVEETPVRRTIDAKEGDSVQVRVAGGKAWLTGNESHPPTDDSTANYAVNIANEANKTVVQVQTLVADEIDAQRAVIGELEADTAKIHNLTADQLSATVGYIGDLTADNVTASDIVADHAMIEDLDVQSMSAATAYIRDLTSENITAQDIIADHATIDTLDSTYATIDELHSDYAEIDLANVNNAWIQSGVIKNGAISDAQIIGVSANKLTAGTIDASNITVTNLNADNITTGTINGQRIGSESITLDKLAEEVPTKAYLDNVAENLQGQIDGQIETWTGTVVPTLNNSPASSWSTADERHKHVGDIYYVVNAGATADGYTYRFTESGTTTKTYSWTLIKDNQITKALQDIIDIQGDISDIESFDSQIGSWKTDTDEELGSLKSRTSTLETGMGNKVDTSTFNEVKQTVDENSASITSLTTTVNSKADSSTVTTLSNTVNSVSQKADANESAISNLTETVDSKADGSTVSTLSQTVNSVQQTANSNSSTISQLTTTLGTNADGTTKAGDIVHRTSTVEQNLDGITTRVGKTEVQVKGTYATSSTGASTQNKVATITPTVTGWELYTGATVTVKFTAKNTTTTPALNVNGTGAKTIKGFNGSALTEAEYKWAANGTITFIYNGTYWLMQNSSTQATRLSNAETEISQNATLIQSKASQTDLNTLTGRVSTAESTITQQATAIEAKVSKDGVIASINASVEEEGGSAVRISADKVNIEGAAIFTGSGRLSSTSLNNAYDSKGSASTAESNAKGYADGLADDLQAEIDAKKSVWTLNTSYSYSYANILRYSAEDYTGTWTIDITTTPITNVKAGDTVRLKVEISDMGSAGNRPSAYIIGTVVNGGADSLGVHSHGLDTTVIDGGNILTNSIGANQIASNAITADKIAAGAITVGKINPVAYYYDNHGQGAGYAKLCTITEVAAYANRPISFAVSNRGCMTTKVVFSYYNNATPTAATVQNATYDGNTNFYYVSKGSGAYDIYFGLTESWDDITVTDYYNPEGESRLSVAWAGAYYGTSLPTGAVQFTKLAGSRTSAELDNAAKTATSYITDIDSQNGITIKAVNGTTDTNTSTGNYVKLNASGFDVYKGGTSVAQYGDTARVGKSNSGHVSIASSGIDLYGGDGTVELAHFGYANSSDSGGGTSPAPYYTLGTRSGAFNGQLSLAQGNSTSAMAYASHAEGDRTNASALCSHAEGIFSTTSGSGFAAHASGYDTIASAEAQTAIGRANVADTTSLFIIGNGTISKKTGRAETRSNALSIDWNGGIHGAGDNYQVVMADVSYAEVKAQNSSLTSSSSNADWIKALLQAICVKYKSRSFTVFKGKLSPNSYGYYEVFIYNTSETSGNVPRYSYGTFRKFNDTFDKFWTNEYAFGYKSVAPSITVSTSSADNISISANGYAEGSIAVPISGYTVLGVLDTYVQNASSSGSGSSFASIYRTYTSGDTYYYGLRNVTNSAIKVRIYAKILYISAT